MSGLGAFDYFQKSQFFRSVPNNTKNSYLILRVQDDFGTIGCLYMVHRNGGQWKSCHLTFDRQPFLDAFDPKTFNVDFNLLHQCLRQSLVADVRHTHKQTIIANHLYPNKVCANNGAHFIVAVFCTYANLQPLRTFAIFSKATWSYDYDAMELRNIQRWGITDGLNRIKFSLLQERPIADNVLLYNNAERLAKDNNTRTKIPIATFLVNEDGEERNSSEEAPTPSSLVQVRPAASHGRGLTNIAPLRRHLPEPQVDRDLDARKELRKIRKREAAARSYRPKVVKIKKK